MTEEANLEFILRKIDETRNYLLDEMKYNGLLSEKYKKTFKYLNYVQHLLIIILIVTGRVSDSVFASLVCVPVPVCVPITSSAIGKIFLQSLQGLKSISEL